MEARLNKNTKIEIPDEEYENIKRQAQKYMSENNLNGEEIFNAYIQGFINGISY